VVFKTVAIVLGQSNGVSKKGNAFQEILIQQGTETLTMLAKNHEMEHVEPYKQYIIEVDYIERFKNFRCLSIESKQTKDGK